MQADAESGYLTLIVHLRQGPSGNWRMIVDAAAGSTTIGLRPATFVIRLHRRPGTAGVRGTVLLQSSGLEAPIHTNLEQIEALIGAWLLGTDSTAGA